MKDIQEEPAYSTHAIEMLKVANEFCIFLEKIENISKEEIIRFIQHISPFMYLKGSLLPNVKVENDEMRERFVTQEQWEGIFNSLREKLIEIDEFWYLRYDSPDQNEPVRASLSENLADIYQDMKDFVLLYQKPLRSSKQNAVNDIKHLFETHWGNKILTVNQWVHYLAYKDSNSEPYSDLF